MKFEKQLSNGPPGFVNYNVPIAGTLLRSSCPDVFCEKNVLRNFTKFTGKHLCQSLFFNKVADSACNFIKKETLAQAFSYEFCEVSKNTFFYRTPLLAASCYYINGSIYCATLNPKMMETLATDQNEFHVGKLVDSFTLHISWPW